ncbi:hypothetical protein H2202_000613 [Exophiala xenobiotica]|nr:hypothetical protein H2202_000613 [Exophiala xenobiotica]
MASNNCTCGKHHRRQMSLCLVLPRHRFGSSRFNTLILLLFRLFYNAGSFDTAPAIAPEGTSISKMLNASAPQAFDVTVPVNAHKANDQCLPGLLRCYQKLSTKEWLHTLSDQASEYSNWKVCSVTWIKALASPFSHEFLQFIAEDAVTGRRSRIAAGREENGDWILVGWDWASGQTPSDHYELPLPLLSLEFDHPQSRPNMLDLSQVLAAVTERQPYYRFRREMCWWYAETALEDMKTKYGGSIKEWQWSRYRYSFIVKTSFIRRNILTKHAEAFKTQLAEGLNY